MNIEGILKKVKKIELRSKKMSNDIFSGAYHTAFKGRGMSFSEVREYMPGDDVRTIDWNVTARLRTPYVKVFQEERELTVMLLIDISYSSFYGGMSTSKIEYIAELAATIAFATQQNNDKIGVLFFSDKVEKYIPPQKGRSHILRIIREIITIKPSGHGSTNIETCLKHFNFATKKRTITFLISDFVSTGIDQHFKVAAKKHDFIGLQVYDASELALPQVGLLQIQDPERNVTHWIDTNDKRNNKSLYTAFRTNQDKVNDFFIKNGAAFIPLEVGHDYTKALRNNFERRQIKH